jgi:sulfur carrier protein ThiS
MREGGLLAESKISETGVAVRVNDDVAWLEIAVDNLCAM